MQKIYNKGSLAKNNLLIFSRSGWNISPLNSFLGVTRAILPGNILECYPKHLRFYIQITNLVNRYFILCPDVILRYHFLKRAMSWLSQRLGGFWGLWPPGTFGRHFPFTNSEIRNHLCLVHLSDFLENGWGIFSIMYPVGIILSLHLPWKILLLLWHWMDDFACFAGLLDSACSLFLGLVEFIPDKEWEIRWMIHLAIARRLNLKLEFEVLGFTVICNSTTVLLDVPKTNNKIFFYRKRDQRFHKGKKNLYDGDIERGNTTTFIAPLLPSKSTEFTMPKALDPSRSAPTRNGLSA